MSESTAGSHPKHGDAGGWGCPVCLSMFPKLDELEHRDEPGCWCSPTKTYTDLVTETEVWVHRYADD